jgi:hypothetical protein
MESLGAVGLCAKAGRQKAVAVMLTHSVTTAMHRANNTFIGPNVYPVTACGNTPWQTRAFHTL